ncbi:MAG: inorganic phosphate transporter, partial [Pseudomonadales bacterium]
MEIIQLHGMTLLIMAAAFGFFMAWGVGANDVANAMGTSVGSRAITIKQAIIIAVIFEFSGAFLAGGEVTSTIRKGIIDPEILSASPELLVYGMIASLLAAGLWLLVATSFGWPVSTTHSIVGAIVGFAAIGISVDSVNWSKVSNIVASWVVSPLMAGVIAFVVYQSVRRFILNAAEPLAAARRGVPVYIFMVAFIISMVSLVKGLKHVGLDLSFEQSLIYAALIASGITVVGAILISGLKVNAETSHEEILSVERVFGVLMIFTACSMAFAHGSNDVANAVGPLAAVNAVIESGGVVAQKAAMPTWLLFLGALGIVIGLVTYGHRVIRTVGSTITELTPSSGFAAELAAAITVVVASGASLPVSTTHTLVGGVIGVGLAHGVTALNIRVVGTIFTSWIVTLPAGAILSITFFYVLKA